MLRRQAAPFPGNAGSHHQQAAGARAATAARQHDQHTIIPRTRSWVFFKNKVSYYGCINSNPMKIDKKELNNNHLYLTLRILRAKALPMLTQVAKQISTPPPRKVF